MTSMECFVVENVCKSYRGVVKTEDDGRRSRRRESRVGHYCLNRYG